MSNSFQDRLTRMGHGPHPVDLIGAGNAATVKPQPELPKPRSFDQNTHATMFTYGLFGVIWMVAMGSLLLFFTYFRFIFRWGASSPSGFSDVAVYICGLIAAFIGYGPWKFLAEL